ncbi:phage tail protein [Cronobacter dublinensis]|uniref:phage tail protein n=1 Tax=Cronobacter dublinensis TaxID=413497 RepID=UPI0003A0004F|nr:phage tail protein [Cronobacter dublinensis]ELY9423059.1 tail fiber protein [Cronobacter dublinensis]MDI6426219.1 phage tail protein [Cronobacter dublinensis]
MAKNDFKPFATGAGANVTSQADWETLPALSQGFTSGKAASAQVNKAIRQSSFVASALAQFIAEQTGADVLDNGNLSAFQLLMKQGLAKLYLSRQDPFGDIKSDGAGAQGKALENLGLGDGSALPVGVPVPWPTATAPAGWLKCNGAVFTAAQYPKLALAYPGLKLPDLRGEFIRGWDDGRGVDSGRALLSIQNFAIQNMTGRFRSRSVPLQGGGAIVEAYGVFSVSNNTGGQYVNLTGAGSSANADETIFDASRAVNTATETRPRNIAFNYIVRAA